MSSSDRQQTDDRFNPRYENPHLATPSPAPASVKQAARAPTAITPLSPGRTPRAYLGRIELRITELANRWFELVARIVIFIIYFWFGFLKLINLSPATPLAAALTSHTIGMQYFNASFKALAVFECGIAILFLIPALTWISLILLVIHMGIVSSPLIIVANVAWTHPLVPTLEGQYIIKDLAIIALAIGILIHRRRHDAIATPQS